MKNLEKIILGTAQFGNDYGINNKYGRPSDHELENILLSALNNDILFLDTAESYGDAQNRIGKFHSNNPSNKFLFSLFHIQFCTPNDISLCSLE